MHSPKKIALIILSLVFVLAALLAVLCLACPEGGLTFSSQRRSFYRLKNRTNLPQEVDFDSNVTLSSILVPGPDFERWSPARAAHLEGYVVAIALAGTESANCYVPCSRDIHLNIAQRQNAPPNEQIVLEVTPRLQRWARSQGLDWSEPTLRQNLLGHWVRFDGWLMFDWAHATESENTAPGRPNNWRGSAWELHPVTGFRVMR